MSKLGKTTTKATFGILNLAMKPLYDQIRKERKEELQRWDKFDNQISQDVQAELAGPRRFEVKQPFDSIIHKYHLW